MRNRVMRDMVALIAAAALVPQSASGAEHTVGGRSVEDVFSNLDLASLATAACSGESDAVASAIRKGVNPNGVGLQGASVLLWAVSCENEAGIEALLKGGADPNFVGVGRYSPTYLAVNKSPATLKLMLKYGGDANATDGTYTALQRALTRGSIGRGWENYYLLIENGADINATNPTGGTVAIDAALDGRFDKVEELLRLGYSHNLKYLGFLIQKPIGHEHEQSRLAAIEILKERGVKFPVARPGPDGPARR